MFRFGKKKPYDLKVDIHSHLIPGIDDGAKSLELSIQMIEAFSTLGFQKLITTPHIHPKYPNTSDNILKGLGLLQKEIEKRNLKIEVEAAAEYYVDDIFLQKVQQDEPLLTFGDNYVLVESAFLNKPIFFETALFELKSRGYQPVLAHPERYRFLDPSLEWLKELKDADILLQVTLGSLGGYYGEIPQKIAKKLMKDEMVDFLGSDLHRFSQVECMRKGLLSKEAQKLCSSPQLRNHSLH